MFASGKATDTKLPPILLGGSNSFVLDNDEVYSLSIGAGNSDNIGLNDLVVVTATARQGLYPVITNSDYTTLFEEIHEGESSATTIKTGVYYAIFNGSLDITFDLDSDGAVLVTYYWFKNVDNTSPIDVAPVVTSASELDFDPYTIDSAAVTTLTDSAIVVNGISVFSRNGATLQLNAAPSNMSAVLSETHSFSLGGSGVHRYDSVVAYASVPSAGSFDPTAFGTAEEAFGSDFVVTDYTFALKPANPVQTAANETVFQGALAVDVDDFPGTGAGVPYSENNNTTFPLTIDANTTFSNGKGIGLGDVVFVAVGAYTMYNITTSDFTALGTSTTVVPEVFYYYAIFNGTPLTLNINKFSSNTDQPFSYQYCSIRYPDTNAPIDVTLSKQEFSGTQSIDQNALTTNTDGAIVLSGLFAYASGESDPATNPPNVVSYLGTPTNMDGSVEVQSQGNYINPFGDPYKMYNALAHVKVDTAGSFDPATWGAIFLTSNQNVYMEAYTLAIKPS